ncbi:MAG: CHAT domain-containing protein, partial [Phaeodactylibacter sp.]|nr:CHAT domain-containing protein [Phaeodactylibacter sp.]
LAYAEQAFGLSERAKALLLRLNRASRLGRKNLPPQLQEEETRRRQALKTAEVAFALDPEGAEQRRELARRRQAYRILLDKIKAAAPEYYRQRVAVEPVKPQKLQEQLGGKQVLLSYFMGAGHYFIFALTNDNFRVLRLSNELSSPEPQSGEWGALMNKNFKKGTSIGIYTKLDVKLKLPALPEAIEGCLRAIRKVDSQRFNLYSNSLYSQLIFPVKDLLAKKEELIIIPHGRLSYLPFEALVSARAEKPEKARYHKYDYLIEDFTVRYHHSASLYAQPASGSHLGEGLLGIAPVFDGRAEDGKVGPDNAFVFDTAYQQSESLRAAVPDGERFSPLLYSETEMNGILKQFEKKNADAEVLMRGEATEEAFKERAGHYRYLHLATHSFLNEATPALSGIAFAQPDGSSREDGILFSPEASALELNAELAVLSSCESGVGPLSEGEGVLSLSRAFFDAGVPKVIASLWKVYDRYTAEMMELFYRGLLRGESPAAALRQAKLKMIRKKATAAPRIWSGMVFFGS